jgi:hypothetical protein
VLFLQDEGGQNVHAIPDLGFCFVGSQLGPIRIEFKVVKVSQRGESVKLTSKQINDWCQSSTFSEKPHCWIGVDEGESQYYFWQQAAIAPLIERVQPARGYRTVHLPQLIIRDSHFMAIFRELLGFAMQQSLCP